MAYLNSQRKVTKKIFELFKKHYLMEIINHVHFDSLFPKGT